MFAYSKIVLTFVSETRFKAAVRLLSLFSYL